MNETNELSLLDDTLDLDSEDKTSSNLPIIITAFIVLDTFLFRKIICAIDTAGGASDLHRNSDVLDNKTKTNRQ